MLHWIPHGGERRRGRPATRWEDASEAYAQEHGQKWETWAEDNNAWRTERRCGAADIPNKSSARFYKRFSRPRPLFPTILRGPDFRRGSLSLSLSFQRPLQTAPKRLELRGRVQRPLQAACKGGMWRGTSQKKKNNIISLAAHLAATTTPHPRTTNKNLVKSCSKGNRGRVSREKDTGVPMGSFSIEREN